MSLTASSIVQRATDIVQDKTSVRWTADEMVRWLNDAQREIALIRPDAFSTYASIALVAGSRQSLPVTAVKLIDITNNTGTGSNPTLTKNAIRQVPRRPLDEQLPGWHGLTGVTTILHYMYDPRDPRTFYVYPPAASTGAAVNAIYAVYPTDVAAPALGADYTGVVGNINVPDIFANAVLDFILYKCYSKDSDYAGNAQRALAHYTTFVNSMGAEARSTVMVGPGVSKPGEVAAGA